ncbi:nucleotidyltransferase family protein [Rhodococcus sp. MEB064]|uniref:nucleotidyltransferase family protein n=1 Tax=Rhodococcus sp. MEB064 TaxID=1587522 RepID=UPI0009E501E5|nr:NTP transferase domain-containing protein [Rhodococcus sp. MEB064]
MRNETALVVLAAGRGSRYGGVKQLARFGPNGETLLEYAAYDAILAGFSEIVLVIRNETRPLFETALSGGLSERVDVKYVVQDLKRTEYAAPSRDTPWGTGHAVLSAASSIRGDFAVINADDFYGRRSYQMLASFLDAPEEGAALVGFNLAETLSDFGEVNRGICRMDAGGLLAGIRETTNIRSTSTGIIEGYLDDQPYTLSGSEIVSMNMWGFRYAVIELLAGQWERFLSNYGSDTRKEFYLPEAVQSAVRASELQCRILQSPERWFGVTYRDDAGAASKAVKKLVASGQYPPSLWTDRGPN